MYNLHLKYRYIKDALNLIYCKACIHIKFVFICKLTLQCQLTTLKGIWNKYNCIFYTRAHTYTDLKRGHANIIFNTDIFSQNNRVKLVANIFD